MFNETLTGVAGFRVGHSTRLDAATGCTVILCPPGTVGGVDVRGGAPGTRETDLLRPESHVSEVTAIMLSGGSAFGLGASQGVVNYLAERGIGYKSGTGFIVPIVPAAILFDLNIGRPDVYPDMAMGYEACANASSDPVEQGTVGAGTGAFCGKFGGKERGTKGGIGSASMRFDNGLVIGAIVAVNAIGDVIGDDGSVIGGLRDQQGQFSSTLDALKKMAAPPLAAQDGNTVIGAIATNAKLSKAHVNKVAQMAHDGIARAVKPAHTMYDGDTIFALASGEVASDATLVGAYAAEVMATAIRQAIYHARGLDGVRAWNE